MAVILLQSPAGDNLEVGHSDVCPFNFSDDQVFNERGDRFAKFKRGEYLNSTGGQNAWKWSYDGIYQASILLNELYENEDLTPEEVTDVRGQARFLRAYFYWLLLKIRSDTHSTTGRSRLYKIV